MTEIYYFAYLAFTEIAAVNLENYKQLVKSS